MPPTDGNAAPDATVVVWRTTLEGRHYLALRPQDSSPDAAWTVPTAVAEDGERLDDAATRALFEQTGLVLALTPVDGSDGTQVFAGRADADAVAVLDDAHHDDHEWLPPAEAAQRCGPAGAGTAIRVVEHWLAER